MRIGKVIGTVTPGQLHPSIVGAQFKIVVPFTLRDFLDESAGVARTEENKNLTSRERLERCSPKSTGTELVVYDELSAGIGEWIAFSEGAEASMAFYPNNKCVDAYAAAIFDTVELDEAAIDTLEL